MKISNTCKTYHRKLQYLGFAIFFFILLPLPGFGTLPALGSESSLLDHLNTYGLKDAAVAIDGNDKVSVTYRQNVAEFDSLAEMLTRIADILVIVTQELSGNYQVTIRQHFDDGQIMEVSIPAINGSAFLNNRISSDAFLEKLNFHPLTRGPMIVAGKCEPNQGNNCSNCEACACYPGEICDPNNPAANERGCVVQHIPANAHLDGSEYVCNDGYEWNGALTDCIPEIVCPPHAFKFQGECECEAGYDWNEDKTACFKVTNLYYPHLACVDGWQTEVCLINPDDNNTLQGTMHFFSNSGLEINPEKSISLAPHARYQFTLDSSSPNASELGYIVFAALSETMCGYQKFYLNGKYRVAIPATRKKISNDNLFISHIASDNIWWTGISLLNTTPTSKKITITFDNGQSKSVLLAGNEHYAFNIASLFDNRKQPGLHSAEISEAAGVVGLQIFGGGNLLSGILLKDETAKALYYPHLTDEAPWWTGIVAYNPHATTYTLRITPYSEDGNMLTTHTVALGSHEKFIGTVSSLGLPAESAWFKVEADAGITGFELFGTDNGNLLAGYTGVGIAARKAIFPKIDDDGWTGIAFANVSREPANIKLTFYNDAGVALVNGSVNVGAHSKILGIAENLLRVDTSGATYMDYSSDQEVVGFQINGSSDDMLLDALPGM